MSSIYILKKIYIKFKKLLLKILKIWYIKTKKDTEYMNKEKLNKKFFEITNKNMVLLMANLISDICINNISNNMPENFNKYIEKTNYFFKDLKNVFEKNFNERKNKIENIEKVFLEFKNEAISFLAVFSNINIIYNKIYSYKNIEKNKKLPKNIILKEIEQFMQYASQTDIALCGGQFLSILPYSLTREFYKDYIKKSLINVFEGLPKNEILNYIDFYKFNFCSINFIKDEKLKNRLIEIFSLNLEILKEQELNNLLEEIEEIKLKYAEIETNILDLSATFLDILAVYNFVFSDVELFEERFILKDLFNATIEMIEKNSQNIMGETILEKIEKETEDILEDLFLEEEELEKIFQKKSFKDINDSEEMEFYLIISETLSKNPEQEIIILNNFKDKDIADEKYIKEKIEEFIKYTESFDFSNKTLKYFKQKFFANIPYCLDFKFLIEHTAYIVENLDGAKWDIFYKDILNFLKLDEMVDDIFNDFEEELHNCCCDHHHH